MGTLLAFICCATSLARVVPAAARMESRDVKEDGNGCRIGCNGGSDVGEGTRVV